MKKTYFIGGIGTDIGKSIATGMIAKYLKLIDKNVITAKLVQTGNDNYSEDIIKHREIMGVELQDVDKKFLTSPEIYKFPSSAHLAAILENRPINFDKINKAIKTLENEFDVVLLEGAGGLAVPLTKDYLTIDFVKDQNYPLILVASSYLGSLNHTILSIEAAKNRGIKIAGIIYNWSKNSDPIIEEDSFNMMKFYLKKYDMPANIIRLPKVEKPYPFIDFGIILKEGSL